METIVKLLMFSAVVVLLASSYAVGHAIIKHFPRKGKPVVDILSATAGSTALLAAFTNLASITHVREGQIEFFNDIFAEPSPAFLFCAAALVSTSLGFSLAKRVDDYRKV